MALPEIVWVSEVFENPRPRWGRGLGEGVCRPGRERRTGVRVEGLGKPVSPTALIAGGRGEPQGAGASRRKGRRFPAPSPPPSPSDEGEGADLLPTQNPEEPEL